MRVDTLHDLNRDMMRPAMCCKGSLKTAIDPQHLQSLIQLPPYWRRALHCDARDIQSPADPARTKKLRRSRNARLYPA